MVEGVTLFSMLRLGVLQTKTTTLMFHRSARHINLTLFKTEQNNI